MSVRTSAVVAGGIALLTVVGVTTIFGDSLVALVAPPRVDLASGAAPGDGASRVSSPGGGPVPAPSATRPAAPATIDGGSTNNADGNS